MSEAPAELWVRPTDAGHWYETSMPDEPDAVRYVRADLFADLLDHYEALQALKPTGEADYPR